MVPRLVFMASGKSRGSNMRSIIIATREKRLDASPLAAVLTRRDSPSIGILREMCVPAIVVSPPEYGERYDDAIASVLRTLDPDLICLCGYMRLMSPDLIRAYPRRILNIHPALLPKYGGKGMYGDAVHEAVIAAGEKETGCTVHFVDEQYDHGEIVHQNRLAVEPGDDAHSLAARLLPLEHQTYVEAIQKVLVGLR
jgi:phosphoribosylglycinamide formyltransferase 1